MSAAAAFALFVLFVVFILLQWKKGEGAEIIFIGGALALVFAGILTPDEALKGFANQAVVTVGAMYVVAAGLRSTGALDLVGRWMLGQVRSDTSALRRITLPIMGISAVLNNTPLVAMMVPVLLDWSRKNGKSPSKLLIPLSYLAILGGTCTLIGTSTNLVVQGLLLKAQSDSHYTAAVKEQLRPMTLFEIGKVGLPCALVGGFYLAFISGRFLPNRHGPMEGIEGHRREYLVEMEVLRGCSLAGKTVEQAGLRRLPGLFLVEIVHGDEVLTPAEPTHWIHEGDRLVFAGIVSTIVDLEKIPGLRPVTDESYVHEREERAHRRLTEVVLSNSSPVIGHTVREAGFRNLYQAAILAVHRNGKRLSGKIGDIRLRQGDTLMLQTRGDFVNTWCNSPDFFLVSGVSDSAPRRHDRAWLALALMVSLIVMMGFSSYLPKGPLWAGWASTAILSTTVACAMFALRCLTLSEGRDAIDFPTLVMIAASFGIGQALDSTGAARELGGFVVGWLGEGSGFWLLVGIYIITVIFTELMSNNATAALMFPIAVNFALQAGCDPRPFVMAVTIGASAGYLSPIGYQTNLMVMGPGGYEPIDFFKCGLPLSILVAITTLTVIPIMWPL